MSEKSYYRELIHAHLINDAAVLANARQVRPKRGIPFLRVAAVTASVFVIAVATVFAIPTARAEVLEWLGISTPVDMLMTERENRPNSAEWNELIAAPVDSSGVVPIPIDRTDSKAVNSQAALKVSEMLYENCDIALGDALFDGDCIYQSIHLNGLSGLYLFEDWVGGNAASVPVDPNAMIGVYGDTLTEEERSGAVTLYEHPVGRIRYELADGTTYGGALDLSDDATETYRQVLRENGLLHAARQGEEAEIINRMNREYLLKNGLVAVAQITPDEWRQHVDADGLLTVKVFYTVAVCEEERGDGSYVPDTELFCASCGTVTIDMKAWETIPKRQADADETPHLWGSDPLTVTYSETLHDDPINPASYRIAYSRYRLDMTDVTIAADPESCTVDALGVHEIRLRLQLPDAWTDDEREAFTESLLFRFLLDGETGAWMPRWVYRTLHADGTLLIRIPALEYVPYVRLQSLQTITCVPILIQKTSLRVINANGETEELLPAYGETVTSSVGIQRVLVETAETAYPDEAVTLHIKSGNE